MFKPVYKWWNKETLTPIIEWESNWNWKSIIDLSNNMYIPYEIGDKVYYFEPYTKSLNNWTIESVTTSKEWTTYKIECPKLTDRFSIDLKTHQIYPSKAVVKEELLQRAVNYANESLIDL